MFFVDLISVPNVSFRVYAPGFFARFMESHAVMFQGNAGLKPKEGEVTSRPWQWPINYRVSGICVDHNFVVIICNENQNLVEGHFSKLSLFPPKKNVCHEHFVVCVIL